MLVGVPNLGPRLQALQITHKFSPDLEALHTEVKSVITACDQVRESKVLHKTLERVLALGNYLNGTSNRGGAYGFKLSDLAKLVQVKSADNKSTLLHYLARQMSVGQHAESEGPVALLQKATMQGWMHKRAVHASTDRWARRWLARGGRVVAFAALRIARCCPTADRSARSTPHAHLAQEVGSPPQAQA